ncbi:MAG: S-layer homology domain-containing protein, partial [Pseudoflavonifractor sp.]
MKKKILSLILCIAMVASMVVVPAFAAETAPVVKDEVITKWKNREILKGYPDGTFKPENNITRGEFAAMLDRLMDYQVAAENTFADVKADAWYATNVLNATAAGVLKGDGTNARPESNITRQEAAVMMARVLKLSGAADKAVTYKDAKLLASWGEDAMLSMAAKGYITATDGALRPTELITRGEVIAMLDAAFVGYFAEAKTYTEDVTGSALVNL